MQRITQALLSGDYIKDCGQLLKDVRGLHAAWMECSESYLDQQETISQGLAKYFLYLMYLNQ